MSRCPHDMSRHMRTTVRLDDALLEQAKREAARRGETVTALIERGLRLVLARPDRRPPGTTSKFPCAGRGEAHCPASISTTARPSSTIAEGRR